jgi:hypothetical protein
MLILLMITYNSMGFLSITNKISLEQHRKEKLARKKRLIKEFKYVWFGWMFRREGCQDNQQDA